MADSADVENALVGLIGTALMPVDYELGAAESSLLGPPVRLYRGWPVGRQLDDDLLAGITNITVYPKAEELNTTRFGREWHIVVPHQHTLTASIGVVGGVVTVGFGGSVTAQNVGLNVNGVGYVHPVHLGDSLSSVPAGLAAVVGSPASAVGADLLLPEAIVVAVHVGGFAKGMRELKRQQRVYQTIIWAPTPVLRDLFAPVVDVALALPQWLVLGDGSTGRLIYQSSYIDDDTSKVGFFRRDLCYSAEYATVQTMMFPEVVIAEANYGPLPPDNTFITVVAPVGALPL